MAGAGRVRRSRRVRETPHLQAARAAGVAPEEWRDWAGLPEELLVKVAATLVAQTEAAWAASLKRESPGYWTEERIKERMAKRKLDGNCPLFVFARVCKPWRKAQLKVGGPLRTRMDSDVIMPGSVALAKWALAEGCPREDGNPASDNTMATKAASYGDLELTKWLCGEGGFAIDGSVMERAAWSGNLELVQWLRGEGCPWDFSSTCDYAVLKGHVEVLRWARANGAPWSPYVRDRAAEELGYTDEFGNLVVDDVYY